MKWIIGVFTFIVVYLSLTTFFGGTASELKKINYEAKARATITAICPEERVSFFVDCVPTTSTARAKKINYIAFKNARGETEEYVADKNCNGILKKYAYESNVSYWSVILKDETEIEIYKPLIIKIKGGK